MKQLKACKQRRTLKYSNKLKRREEEDIARRGEVEVERLEEEDICGERRRGNPTRRNKKREDEVSIDEVELERREEGE